MDSIYLDHNATTPPHPEVIEAIARASARGWANPASQHRPGQQAHKALEDAREEIAHLLGADLAGSRPDRLIFTSGGTEANNLAILGVCRTSAKPGHLVISAVEHASVLAPGERLLEDGWQLDCLGVDATGVVCAERLKAVLQPHTRLVSVLLANHETGVLQPIEALSGVCRAAGVPLHTDAIQAIGKLEVNFRQLGVSAMSVAAHKFRGPLGIGCLVLRHDLPLSGLMYGGAQQYGLRPGTECVPLVLGMLVALRLAHQEQAEEARRLSALRTRFEDGLCQGFPGLVVHGRQANRLPNTASIAFPGLDGQVLLMALDLAGVACSAGSACSSGSQELSPTLLAMGIPHHLASASLRFSLGAGTTEAEIDEAVRRILEVCGQIGG